MSTNGTSPFLGQVACILCESCSGVSCCSEVSWFPCYTIQIGFWLDSSTGVLVAELLSGTRAAGLAGSAFSAYGAGGGAGYGSVLITTFLLPVLSGCCTADPGSVFTLPAAIFMSISGGFSH